MPHRLHGAELPPHFHFFPERLLASGNVPRRTHVMAESQEMADSERFEDTGDDEPASQELGDEYGTDGQGEVDDDEMYEEDGCDDDETSSGNGFREMCACICEPLFCFFFLHYRSCTILASLHNYG